MTALLPRRMLGVELERPLGKAESAGELMIRPARAGEGRVLAAIHQRSFPRFFLSSLGPRFLALFYERLIDGAEIVLVATEAGRAIGFAAGSTTPAGFYSRLLRRDGLRFALASVPALMRKPVIAPRLARALTKPAEEAQRPEGFATLMSIGVEPDVLKTGVGRRLLDQFVAAAAARGARGVDLTTDRDDNDAVNAFYLRNGFVVRRTFVTPEGRRMNEYERPIEGASAVRESPTPAPHGMLYPPVKRAMDVAGSLGGLVVLAPMLVSIGALVRATSPGPMLFRQERVGRGGRRFHIYKFRTMRLTGASSGPLVTAGGDPRVTPTGRVLRRYKLDELPQLWNVLRGDMSLVGPRPEVPKYVAVYPEEWAAVLAVRPGITDFAAIEFVDEEATLAKSDDPERAYVEEVLPKKLALYRKYIEQQSLGTDLHLIFSTLRRIVG